MSAMQNSPSSDSAYSTGSENGFNSVQFIPIQLNQEFNQQETVTLYDTEITYNQSNLPTTTTTPSVSTRVPRYHSYHELMNHEQQPTGQNNRSSEWLNLLNSDDKLKPEDFLAEPANNHSADIKVEESMDIQTDQTEPRDDKLPFFPSQNFNLDEVFENEVFGHF